MNLTTSDILNSKVNLKTLDSFNDCYNMYNLYVKSENRLHTSIEAYGTHYIAKHKYVIGTVYYYGGKSRRVAINISTNPKLFKRVFKLNEPNYGYMFDIEFSVFHMCEYYWERYDSEYGWLPDREIHFRLSDVIYCENNNIDTEEVFNKYKQVYQKHLENEREISQLLKKQQETEDEYAEYKKLKERFKNRN